FYPGPPPCLPATEPRQPSSLSRALSPEGTLGGSSPLPMTAEHPRERVEPVRVQPGSDLMGAATHNGEIELLIRTLATETRAQNYLQAADAARQLDSLLTSA